MSELLKPRFKVIADYPNNTEFDIGDIVSPKTEKSDYNNYPAIFKKLEWYEDRSAEEIGYICFNGDYHYVVGKVVRVLCDGWGNEIFRLNNCRFDVRAKLCYPATKQEYDEFNASKTPINT